MISVERPVTVAVAGAHSTGKSTFVARLARMLRQQDMQVATVADLGEQALQIGLPILHSHTYTSTLWIMAQGISNEIAAWAHVDVLLVDRPVPDALGYYLAALDYRGEAGEPDALAHLHALAVQHSVHYDLVYRTVLDEHVPLGTDKPRDRDLRFRSLADIHVGRILSDLGIRHRPLPAARHKAAIDEAASFVMRRLTDAATAAAGVDVGDADPAAVRLTGNPAAPARDLSPPALPVGAQGARSDASGARRQAAVSITSARLPAGDR